MENQRKRICLVVEGCYPYVVGGVSSWVHNLIKEFPEHDFIIQTIIADRKTSGKFKYELPENVVAVKEIYLNDYNWVGTKKEAKRQEKKRSKERLSEKHYNALKSYITGETIQWENFFEIFQKTDFTIDQLLMGEDFYYIVKEYYEEKYPNIIFTDFLWTVRSMMLPLCFTLKTTPIEADIYHCVATGYAGIWGSMAKWLYPHSKLLISEHGIYTREREEELVKAKWVQGVYKDLWIHQFRKLSTCAYLYADIVTSLFENAQHFQVELGCDKEKTLITPNGIDVSRFSDMKQKEPSDDYINIGAVVRITPIKDIKTMINAFYYAKKKNPKLRLWIMGPATEEPEYAQECYDLVSTLEVEDVNFTGQVNVTDYLGQMDMTILSSISEGQPLTILEGFAAHKPAIATNVGNCEGLIYGENDAYGKAGIVVPIMSVMKLSEAILKLSENKELREQMGQAGYERVTNKYRLDQMQQMYQKIYSQLLGKEE